MIPAQFLHENNKLLKWKWNDVNLEKGELKSVE